MDCIDSERSQLLLRNTLAVKGTEEEGIEELLCEGGAPFCFE
jgi:hypothetical protein